VVAGLFGALIYLFPFFTGAIALLVFVGVTGRIDANRKSEEDTA